MFFSRSCQDVICCTHLSVAFYIAFHNCYQVEFAFPPLSAADESDSSGIPSVWKNLPSLALPDGAHNFIKGLTTIVASIMTVLYLFTLLLDTVYFHLPSCDASSTVFGVSCYRQIDAKVCSVG